MVATEVAVYQDIIRDSWVYQEILQEGAQKALQLQRQAILAIVQKRFPALASLAQQKLAGVIDPEQLQDVNVQISVAQDSQEVVAVLTAL